MFEGRPHLDGVVAAVVAHPGRRLRRLLVDVVVVEDLLQLGSVGGGDERWDAVDLQDAVLLGFWRGAGVVGILGWPGRSRFNWLGRGPA